MPTIDQVGAAVAHTTTCEGCGYSRTCQIDDCGDEHAGYAVVRDKRQASSPVLLCARDLDKVRQLATR